MMKIKIIKLKKLSFFKRFLTTTNGYEVTFEFKGEEFKARIASYEDDTKGNILYRIKWWIEENYEKEYIKLLDKDSIEGKKFYLDSYGKWLDDCWRT